MATVKAIVRRSKVNSQGLSVVYIQYGHDQRTTLFSTGVKVKPSHWNDKKQLVDSARGVKKIVANKDLIRSLENEDNVTNALIGIKASEIRQLSKRLSIEQVTPTVYAVKLAYARQQEGKDILKGNFFDLLDEYIEDNKQRLKYGTIKQVKVLKNHLLGFEKFSKKRVSLETVNKSLITKFVNYLVQEKGMVNDSTNSYLKRLKTFLRHLYDEGYLPDRSFDRVKSLITASDSEKDIVYVTNKEFDKIRTHDLGDNKRLEKVRDLFIIGCCTGLRYGDLVRVGPEHIIGDYIEITSEKTTKRLTIPINSVARSILNKYQNQPPHISNQKFNQYIKELAKLVKLNQPINRITYKGNQPTEKSYVKHELLSSHSMRRTFITLAKEFGMTTETIMKIVGHSSYEMTKRYQEIDKESMAKEMKVWDEPVMKVVE